MPKWNWVWPKARKKSIKEKPSAAGKNNGKWTGPGNGGGEEGEGRKLFELFINLTEISSIIPQIHNHIICKRKWISTKGKLVMPLVKMIRGGQVTFPKVFRDKFGLKEGDLMEYEITENGIFFKPKEVIDRGEALKAFSKALAKMQAKAGNKFKDMSEEELYDLIEEAVQSGNESNSAK